MYFLKGDGVAMISQLNCTSLHIVWDSRKFMWKGNFLSRLSSLFGDRQCQKKHPISYNISFGDFMQHLWASKV